MLSDVVFEEIYGNRVRILIENAYKQGQAVGIGNMLGFMKEFESKQLEITHAGMIGFLESIHYKPKALDPVADVIQRAEVAIKKAEETLPIPDNVVALPVSSIKQEIEVENAKPIPDNVFQLFKDMK